MTDPRCGTPAGYHAHVRDRTEKCAPCRRAAAEKRADYRRRRYLHHAPLAIDVTGTRRRIQALVAIGWPLAEQSRRLGMERSAVHKITGRTWVAVETAEKIRALYDELSMVPGPSNRSRIQAARRGWATPLAWDDEQIDDPAAKPARPPTVIRSRMNRDAEREEKVMELTRAGLSATEIAVRMRTNKRYVQRIRARFRDDEQAAS